jgi:hypothetical protein
MDFGSDINKLLLSSYLDLLKSITSSRNLRPLYLVRLKEVKSPSYSLESV